MPDVTITYNNSTITLNDSGTEVLETEGTYLTDDITIKYTKPTPTLQSKSATPTESAQTIMPDSGYDGLSQVSVGAISSSYVGSNVPRQAAQTITPTTTDQTIASGKYLTGTQTIKGDANLLAENIKKDVALFGITGTLESGGGGGLVYETGTKRPASDTNSMSINFARSHTNRPFCVIIADTNSKAAAEGSCLYWECVSLYDLFIAVPYSDTKSIYGSTKYVYRTSSGTSTVTSNQTSETALNTSVSSSGFAPNADTRYFRANRAYKWIAVWKPTA